MGILALLDVLALGWWGIISIIKAVGELTSAILENLQEEVCSFFSVSMFPSNSASLSKGSGPMEVQPATAVSTTMMRALSVDYLVQIHMPTVSYNSTQVSRTRVGTIHRIGLAL